MIDGKILVEKLIVYAKAFLSLKELDVIFTRNLLLGQFKLNAPYNGKEDLSYVKEMTVPDELISDIVNYALEQNFYDNELEANLFANYIMGIITPKPSEINSTFMFLKEHGGAQNACDFLYNLCIKNNYIQKTAIDKNIKWNADELDIPLEVTINLSKPEKNNKDIAKLLTAPQGEKYPACLLCKENEGYYGTATHPARTNIKTISVKLGGEEWGMQYSPYLYFNEHCILFNKKHIPMKMDGNTIEKLLDFIEIFPDYFIGSNSDLPIVGGSILNHEHYQGGKHDMPMHKCKILKSLSSDRYDDLEIGVLNWYNSVIRIAGLNRNTVQYMATEIVEAWKVYSDESVGVIASTDGVRHNTVTPIVRFLKDGRYCVELILRNNRVSEEFPDGIYHAHPEYHNIKKEGIGLIEAMGLYILPARLKRQMNDVADILCGNVEYDSEAIATEGHDLYVHRDMIAHLKDKYSNVKTKEKAETIIRNHIDKVCSEILYNTGVFKKDKEGIVAFNKFLASVGIK